MARGLVLLGFALYFLNLCLSGDLQKYINMKYAYMVYFAVAAFVLLAIVQFWTVWSAEKRAKHSHHDHSHHDHSHHDHSHHDHSHHDHSHQHVSAKASWKKSFFRLIFVLPLFTGFIFPVATLNSYSATNKGIDFPVAGGTSWQKYNQILQPDTSAYYSSDSYNQRMEQTLQMMNNENVIVVNDTNYLSVLETLYKNQKLLQGKEIQISGFAFHDKTMPANSPFLLRFGMVHCILDSGVYGLNLSLPSTVSMQTDGWYQVTGVLSETYYAPVDGMIPCVQVENVKAISKPSDPYVYVQF